MSRTAYLLLTAVCAALGFSSVLLAGGDAPVPHGFLQEGQNVRWMDADGVWAQDEWQKQDGKRYYFGPDGYLRTGFLHLDGETYYLDPYVKTGWLRSGKDYYYFYEDGTMARNVTMGNLQIDADGKMSYIPPEPEETPLQAVVRGILKQIVTEDMEPEEKIRACYRYLIDHTVYERFYEAPSGEWTWTRDYAEYVLTTGQGNCYRYASGLAYLVKELGFDVKVITGEVKARRGGTTPHSWVEILLDGEWFIFDCELEDANGTDLFRKTYRSYPIKPLNKLQEWRVDFYD